MTRGEVGMEMKEKEEESENERKEERGKGESGRKAVAHSCLTTFITRRKKLHKSRPYAP